MYKPTIVIIGNRGQVGWQLQRTISTLGNVYSLGKNTTPSADLSDFCTLRTTLHALRPDWIINAAAYTSVDLAESDYENNHRVNGVAPGILAEEARNIGAKLVHYSTDYVFDGKSTTPYIESDETNPINAYGSEKLRGEQNIESVDGEYLIFRTSWVYDNRGNNFLRTMLRLSLEKESLSIVDDQIGAPTWSRSIAEATAQIISQVGDSELSERKGLYHMSCDGQTTWYGFAKAIFELTKHELTVQDVKSISTKAFPTPAKRPLYSCLDNSKLARNFSIFLPNWRHALMLCMEAEIM